MDDLLRRADRNMATAWEAQLAATRAPGVVRGDGYTILSSGLPVALFNPTFVLDPQADPAAVVADVTARHDGPFVLYARDEVAPGVADAGIAAGLVEHFRPPLMVLDDIPSAAPAPPDGLVIERVDAATAGAWAEVLAAGFHMPPELAGAVFGPTLLDVDGVVALLGRVAGEPVTTAAVFVAEGLAGVYNVATVPTAGRRGFGAAITIAAAVAGRAHGATTSILQASAEGVPVYERLGYRVADRYRQLEGGAT